MTISTWGDFRDAHDVYLMPPELPELPLSEIIRQDWEDENEDRLYQFALDEGADEESATDFASSNRDVYRWPLERFTWNEEAA